MHIHKYPPLFWLKKSLFNKKLLFQRKMVSKILKKFSSSKRKAVLNLFSTQFDFKSYLRNNLKTHLLSKSTTISPTKKQKFRFSTSKMFSNQSLWLSFVLKAFDFNRGVQFLSK
jgi:hypothetical protein